MLKDIIEVRPKMLQRAVRRALRRKGYDLVRRRSCPDINMFLDTHDVDLVVDVGANEGQFASYIRRWGYHNRILSFEPTSAAYGVLRSRADIDDRWQADRIALGAETGSVDINVSGYSVFSSIKQIKAEAEHYDARARYASVERVQIDTLDNLLKSQDARKIFLKIDTQGFEKEVLSGAAISLHRVEGLLLELPITAFYEDSWTFIEALSHVESLGFVPAQFSLTSPMLDDAASAVEFDCIFRRKMPIDTA